MQNSDTIVDTIVCVSINQGWPYKVGTTSQVE